MSAPKQNPSGQLESSQRASEYQRLHELTRSLQVLIEVWEAFGDPDRSPGCGYIIDRSERLAMLQQWRAEKRMLGDRTPAPPQWEVVRDGPRWIYTRLSNIIDVHVGIHVTGKVAIKLFDKGKEDTS
jgi:hypothetical protein